MMCRKTIAAILFLLVANSADATEMSYQFKNPSFGGQGASAHWLTIENQETSRKKVLQDKLEADLKAQATAANNSILNRFMNNLQSRIYSQLAQQLTENLFANDSTTGTFTLDDNTISYEKTTDSIILKITDTKGAITEITVPIGQFGF